MAKAEKNARRCGVIACEIFALAIIALLLADRKYDRLPLAFATPLIILVPELVERLFHCRIALPVYLFGLLYSIGPMLGHCCDLYYLTTWWDKLLHVTGGVMFAFFGLFLFERFVGKETQKTAVAAIFALCFSMTVAVLWEFCEFGADTFFGADMQNDTVITQIHSYLLGNLPGAADSIKDITEVTINGQALPVEGYIDIGLIDSMLDMLLESAGAAIVAAAYIFSKGKFSPFAVKPTGDGNE